MRILIIADSIDVNDSSGSKVNVALIQNLQKIGYQIRVLHYTHRKVALDGIDCRLIAEDKTTARYFASRLQRVFSRLTKINLNPALEGWFGFSFTFLNDTYSIASAIGSNDDFRSDLVLTLSKGASFRPHYALLKRPELHHKWMAYIHDPYPFHYYPRPYNWIQPGFRQKEAFFRKVSEKASFSAFPSLLLQEWMGSYFPNFNKTGIVIPHQISDHVVKNRELPAYFDPAKFTLLHAGNLMKQRSPEFLIQAFESFLLNNPSALQDSCLLLLGPADFYTEMLETYQESLPQLVVKNSNIEFDTVFNLQNNATVNIILESKAEISPFLPGKFPHCVFADKPILLLGPYYSETKRLLGDDYPFWSEADDKASIGRLIETLYSAWQKGEKQRLDRADLRVYLDKELLLQQLNALTIC